MNEARDKKIRMRREAGETYASIAKDYGLSRERIRGICKGKTHEEDGKEGTVLFRYLTETNAILCVNGKKSNVPLLAYEVVLREWLIEGNDGYPTMEFFLNLTEHHIMRIPGGGKTISSFIAKAQSRWELAQVKTAVADVHDGKILREKRVALGLTQQEVADSADIPLQSYQKFEGGKRQIRQASFDIASRVLDALELDITDFHHRQIIAE